MLIERVQFRNFKVLRDAELPLGQLTVLVGANGSGKSTAIEGLLAAKNAAALIGRRLRSACAEPDAFPEITITFSSGATAWAKWQGNSASHGPPGSAEFEWLQNARLYSFDPRALEQPATLAPGAVLGDNGQNLPAGLDQMRDASPERFHALNLELHRWLPEYDQVLFETPGQGLRSVMLRHSGSKSRIPATELSYGTLAAVATLSIAYAETPPSLVCFEEPDRGIHPRLLRHLQEALYRLAYPASFGETREPTQVIVTTHSPYFLDLFKDNPEEVVVAEKTGEEAQFKRLVEIPDFEEIVGSTPLGEVWYSGFLGGVPAA